VLDNPFSVAVARSDKAGKVLAHALISKVQGERPVTLVGYSLGARVIYSCLLELAEQNAFGLVESVVLMGAPTPSDSSAWRRIRAVVSARVVNVYSTEDFILGFLYRTSKALVGAILRRIGFEDVDAEQVEEQVTALKFAEEKEKEEKRREKGKINTEAKEEDVPWKPSKIELPAPVRELSNSQVMPSMSRTPLAAEPKNFFPASHDQPQDESDEEEDRRIVMLDLEENGMPPSEQPQASKPTKMPTVEKTEIHQQAPKIEVMPVGSESDTDSIASVPLGEMTVLEPLPEPEPEVEIVQFGSSVQGF
jgi:hypothetical protein